MIRRLARQDLSQVVDLHLACLTGLLTTLGRSAVRAYYLGSLSSRRALSFVADEKGKVLGFVSGSADPAGLRRDAVAAQPVRTVLGIAGGVLRRPRALRDLASAVAPWSPVGYQQVGAELTYLAVTPEARRGRYGAALVAAFGDELQRQGLRAYELSVDADNRSARQFYQALGFRLVCRYREFGIEHDRLRIEWASAPAPDGSS